MKKIETAIPGAFVLELEPIEDRRGFFVHLWSPEDFAAVGLSVQWDHLSIAFNERRGTVRGLHYQVAPHEENKLIRCSRGRIFDVLVDVRPGSPAFGRFISEELSADGHRMLFAPPGVAHGYQTLEDRTEVIYLISGKYKPDCARGVLWKDPALGIRWPVPMSVISDRDQALPPLRGSQA